MIWLTLYFLAIVFCGPVAGDAYSPRPGPPNDPTDEPRPPYRPPVPGR